MSKDRQALLDIDFQTVMNTPSGRKVLLHLLDHAGYFGATYSQNERDHVYNEGRRAEGVYLAERLIRVDPDKFMMIVKEKVDGY